jgi:hypothetical protein
MLLGPWRSVSRRLGKEVRADLCVHVGGRYLVSATQREGLKQLLLTSSREVGWPVHCIIEDLEAFWSR